MINNKSKVLIQHPKTINDFDIFISDYKNVFICGGGTHFMRAYKDYTQSDNLSNINIANLSNIYELVKFTETTRYLEIGASINLESLLKTEHHIPSCIKTAIKSFATSSIREQITIAGTIVPNDPIYCLACPLAALDVQVGIHTANKGRLIWIPIEELYGQNRNNYINNYSFIHSIRIPNRKKDNVKTYTSFISFGDVIENAKETVFISYCGDMTDFRFENFSLCTVFPNLGILKSKILEKSIKNIEFPATEEELNILVKQYYWELLKIFPSKERKLRKAATNMFYRELQRINFSLY